MSLAIDLVERGLVPDFLTRRGIRRLVAQRAAEEAAREGGDREAWLARFVAELRGSPVAVHTDAANEQHYEVPPAFFRKALGPHLKYSSCYYPSPGASLAEAEEAMLALTCERAGLGDGQNVLELGCGWGSLTLWMAARHPASRITAVSNSAPQREFITARAAERGLRNVRVVTADANELDAQALGEPGPPYDRIVSVEMFEHMRNYDALLRRIAGWLAPDGRLFVHVFCHRTFAYPFETEGDDNWMGRHFFTGGIMPSYDLLPRFDRDVRCEERWWVDGTHYARTAEDWLRNVDLHRGAIRELFRDVYGAAAADRWLQRWRVFFLSCAELFGHGGGAEWGVGPRGARRTGNGEVKVPCAAYPWGGASPRTFRNLPECGQSG